MPKIIKFDLPIDGIRAKNIEEIRDHFTLEILDHYRSGLLAKWLASRRLQEELSALQAIEERSDQAIFKRLCEIFAVEVYDAVIAVLFNESAPKFSLNVAEFVTYSETDSKVIDFSKLMPIQNNVVKLFNNRILCLDTLESLDNMTLILEGNEGALIFKDCTIGKIINKRYCDLNDGTVLDIENDLQWMRCALGQTWADETCTGEACQYEWDAANNAVDELNNNGGYAGHMDWRLPSLSELEELVVKGQEPAIDQQAFPNTQGSWFWAGYPEEAFVWIVSFGNGDTDRVFFSNDDAYTYIGYKCSEYKDNHIRLVRRKYKDWMSIRDTASSIIATIDDTTKWFNDQKNEQG
ncbi:DUF1566 domain-containing protein [Chromatium okenii]|uniref:Lcl C-terminal domain-containing protein n=1 Tax=Chromatium okenii TaxID=61644 RepID=UPI0026F0931D|nr:DUF1566 domain-containing protein [Chromatium okenii]MBV5309934.1 DUF1566 domain-containing protein [Chromatium okenii]